MGPRRRAARHQRPALAFQGGNIRRVQRQRVAIIFHRLAGQAKLFIGGGNAGKRRDIARITGQRGFETVDGVLWLAGSQRGLSGGSHLQRNRLQLVVAAGCSGGSCGQQGQRQQERETHQMSP